MSMRENKQAQSTSRKWLEVWGNEWRFCELQLAFCSLLCKKRFVSDDSAAETDALQACECY